MIIVDGQPKYVGECENLSSRYNSGYGNISPRNCFTGGQPTNCRINKKILQEAKNGKQIKLLFKETNNRFSLEANLIQELNPEWNKTLGKSIQKTKKTRKNKPQKKSSSKYFPLQKYLEALLEEEKSLTYSEIEKILGFELPQSAYEYGVWWSNGSHTQANAWLDAGWLVYDINLGNSVTFVKKSSWKNVEVVNGKKIYWFCATPFIQVKKKKNNKNSK